MCVQFTWVTAVGLREAARWVKISGRVVVVSLVVVREDEGRISWGGVCGSLPAAEEDAVPQRGVRFALWKVLSWR